jgi:hypothetical protein
MFSLCIGLQRYEFRENSNIFSDLLRGIENSCTFAVRSLRMIVHQQNLLGETYEVAAATV